MSDLVLYDFEHVNFSGFVPGFYRSLSMILRNYLGIEDYHIFYPRYRCDSYEKDIAVWYLRPISEYLLLGASRNCLYLPALYKIIRKGQRWKVRSVYFGIV